MYNSSLYDTAGGPDQVYNGRGGIPEIGVKRRVEVEDGVKVTGAGFSVSVEHSLVGDVVVDTILIEVSKESGGVPVFTMCRPRQSGMYFQRGVAS